MTETNFASPAPRRPWWKRRHPIGSRPFVGTFPPDPYVTIIDRGMLIASHPIDPEIYKGGRFVTVVVPGRLACLMGLLHGRLKIEVCAHMWHPPTSSHD